MKSMLYRNCKLSIHQVAMILIDLMTEDPDFFQSPQGKDNYCYYIGKVYGIYPGRAKVKSALKLLLKLGCIIRLPNAGFEYSGVVYENECSRYELVGEVENEHV